MWGYAIEFRGQCPLCGIAGTAELPQNHSSLGPVRIQTIFMILIARGTIDDHAEPLQ